MPYRNGTPNLCSYWDISLAIDGRRFKLTDFLGQDIKEASPFRLASFNCGFPLCSFSCEMHLHPRNAVRMFPKTLFLSGNLCVRIQRNDAVPIDGVVVRNHSGFDLALFISNQRAKQSINPYLL
jgi:hypothetical protein